MRFTLSWLREHLDTEEPLEGIVEALTMLGLEVEGVEDRARDFAAFTVARVVSAGPHPNADRLTVCDVDTGAGTVRVVCGAPNARAGMMGVFAPSGSVIPGTGHRLEKAVIRGVESNGMLLSERELGISDEHDGIVDLPEDAPLGAPYARVAGLDDPVIEIGLTPNRGDCAGVRGIARDLAARGLGTLKPASRWGGEVRGRFASPVGVRLELDDPAACPLFAGRYIRGVANGPSPPWLRDRLKAVGLRPISALVDITNFFSLDMCRPLHVFDADRLVGDVVVRPGRAGETLEALDGRTYGADSEMTMIADEARANAFGGIMGGEPTGCTEATTNVFLESALFDPLRTAATGRRLGVHSDARYRFERGVDPTSAVAGMEAATAMILEICGGEPSEPVVAGAEPDWRRGYALRPGRVGELGGVTLPDSRIRDILGTLGFDIEDAADGLLARPPPWRPDIQGEADLVEEVLRVHGFEHVPVSEFPSGTVLPSAALTRAATRAVRVRRALAAAGMTEAVTFSFLPSDWAVLFGGGDPALNLDNPISSDLNAMRPSVLPNLIDAGRRNADRGVPAGALFEVGPVYRPEAARIVPEGGQLQNAAGVRWGATERHWAETARPVDAYDAKSDALAALAALDAPMTGLQVSTDAPTWFHPGRSGALRLGANVLAHFGELHPGVLRTMGLAAPAAAFEVFLDAVPEPRAAKAGKRRPVLRRSAFQPVERDFAFVVDEEVAAEALVRAVRGADRTLIDQVAVFDVYRGEGIAEGRKSVALSVVLQPMEATLTDGEIEKVAERVVAAVRKATGAELRGKPSIPKKAKPKPRLRGVLPDKYMEFRRE